MEPIDKAIQLMNLFKCKQSAIILCNEIIDNNKNIVPFLDYSPDLICSTQYWKKVIEKIKTL